MLSTTVKLGTDVTYTFLNFKDTWSRDYGTFDGYSICGTRTYTYTCSGFMTVHKSGDKSD